MYVVGNTLFVIPLEESLGITRGTTGLLFALGSFMTGIAAPISGLLIDRRGPKKVLIASALITALGYALFATAQSTLQVFVYFLVFISPVALNVAFHTSIALMNNWFFARKSMAMSILGIGSGVGAVIIVPSLALIIENYGWRAAAMVAAGIVLILSVPPALLTKNSPEEVGLTPDGLPPAHGAQNSALRGLDTRAALRTPAFWLMTGAATCFGGAQVGLGIHFVPIMVWKGVDEIRAALMLSAMALMNVPLSPFVGWAADRWGRLVVPACIGLVSSVGALVLLLADTEWQLWLAIVLLAGNMGMYPLLWAAMGFAFGRRSFSTIRGYALGGQVGGTLLVPFMAGVMFDITGGYTQSLAVIAALLLGSFILLMVTPRHSHVPSDST